MRLLQWHSQRHGQSFVGGKADDRPLCRRGSVRAGGPSSLPAVGHGQPGCPARYGSRRQGDIQRLHSEALPLPRRPVIRSSQPRTGGCASRRTVTGSRLRPTIAHTRRPSTTATRHPPARPAGPGRERPHRTRDARPLVGLLQRRHQGIAIHLLQAHRPVVRQRQGRGVGRPYSSRDRLSPGSAYMAASARVGFDGGARRARRVAAGTISSSQPSSLPARIIRSVMKPTGIEAVRRLVGMGDAAGGWRGRGRGMAASSRGALGRPETRR